MNDMPSVWPFFYATLWIITFEVVDLENTPQKSYRHTQA
jgi:hypothetical protein